MGEPNGVVLEKDLQDALDLIEEEQWGASSEDPLSGDFDPACPWCLVDDGTGAHSATCRAALLLRKHGRKVRIEGDDGT